MLTNIRHSGDSKPRVDTDNTRRAGIAVCDYAHRKAAAPATVAAELLEILGLHTPAEPQPEPEPAHTTRYAWMGPAKYRKRGDTLPRLHLVDVDNPDAALCGQMSLGTDGWTSHGVEDFPRCSHCQKTHVPGVVQAAS